jgi:hypothetical protein
MASCFRSTREINSLKMLASAMKEVGSRDSPWLIIRAARRKLIPLLPNSKSKAHASSKDLKRSSGAGGYSSYIADPDDNLWEIAWNPFLPMDEEGNGI